MMIKEQIGGEQLHNRESIYSPTATVLETTGQLGGGGAGERGEQDLLGTYHYARHGAKVFPDIISLNFHNHPIIVGVL